MTTDLHPANTIPQSKVARVDHGVWRRAAWSAAIATLVNLAIRAVGNQGAPVRVVTGWAPDGASLSIGEVVATTIVAVLSGAVLLWVLARRSARPLRQWRIVAAAFAVLSAIPLWRLDVDTGSKLALTCMHLATGLIAIAAQHLANTTRSES